MNEDTLLAELDALLATETASPSTQSGGQLSEDALLSELDVLLAGESTPAPPVGALQPTPQSSTAVSLPPPAAGDPQEIDFEGSEGKGISAAPYDAGLNRYSNLNPQDVGRVAEHYEQNPRETPEPATAEGLPKYAPPRLNEAHDKRMGFPSQSSAEIYANNMTPEEYEQFYNLGNRLLEMQKGAADPVMFRAALATPEEQAALAAAESRADTRGEALRSAVEGFGRSIPGSRLAVPETAGERARRSGHIVANVAGGIAGNVAGAVVGGHVVGKGLQLAGKGALKAANMIKMSSKAGQAVANAGRTAAQVASSKIAQEAATRVLTQMAMNTGQQLGRDDVESIWDGSGVAVTSALASMLPEVFLPPGLLQAIGQPAADFAHDMVVKAARGEVWNREDWIREFLTLGVSAGFGIRDAASGKTFAVKQAAQKAELGRLGRWLHGAEREGRRTGKAPRFEFYPTDGQGNIATEAFTSMRPEPDAPTREQTGTYSRPKPTGAAVKDKPAFGELPKQQYNSEYEDPYMSPKPLPEAPQKQRENTRVEASESKAGEASARTEERSPDEAGRAQEGAETEPNNTRAKFDALQTLDVNTAEVKSLGRGEGFRQRVVGWLAQKDVFGEYRNRDKGWDIVFNNRGARNVMGHTAHDGKVALLEYAPDLIENGIYLETIPKRAGLDSHIFAAKAVIDGEPSTIGIVVRDDGNGKRYYDHAIRIESGDRAEPSLRVQEATAGNPPEDPNTISNIVQRHLNHKRMAAVGDKIAEIEAVSKPAPAPSTVKVKEVVGNVDNETGSGETVRTPPATNKIPNPAPEVKEKIKNLSEPPEPKPKATGKTEAFWEQITHNGAPTEHVEVQGTRLEIDGQTYFVHQRASGSWSVNEATTGLNVVGGYAQKKGAVEAATKTIMQVGKDKMDALIKKQRDFVGETPWRERGEPTPAPPTLAQKRAANRAKSRAKAEAKAKADAEAKAETAARRKAKREGVEYKPEDFAPVPEDPEAVRAAERDAEADAEKEPVLKKSARKGFSSDKEAREASERAVPGDIEDIGTRKGQKGHYHQFQFGDRIFGLRKDAADATHGTVYEQDASGRGVPLSKEKVTAEEAKRIIAQHLRDTPGRTKKFSHNPPPDYSSIDPRDAGRGGGRSADENDARGTFDIELSSGVDNARPAEAASSGLYRIEAPELVKMFRSLLKGAVPSVKRKLARAALGTTKRDKNGDPKSVRLGADIFKDPKVASRVMAHEIGHIDHTAGAHIGELIENMRDGMAFIMEKPMPGESLDIGKIHDELYDVSKDWRPFDESKASASELAYRNSPEELYADAVSVLLSDPDLLAQRAPTAFKAIMDGMRNKPDFYRPYQEIISLYGMGDKAVTESRRRDVHEGFEAARKAKVEYEKRKKESADAGDGVGDYILKELDRYKEQLVDEYTRIARIGGQNSLAYQLLRSLSYIEGRAEVYLSDVETAMKEVFGKKGFSDESRKNLGEYMLYNRIATERADMANPGGTTKEIALKQLEHMKNELGAETFVKLAEAAEAYRKVREEHILPYLFDDDTYGKELREYALNNPNYATFDVVKGDKDGKGGFDEAFKDGVSGKLGIHKQVGTLNSVGNPFDATVANDLKLVALKAKNDAVRAVIDLLKEDGHPYKYGEAVAGEAYSDGRRIFAAPPDGMRQLKYVQDGKLHAYNVDKVIGDMLIHEPVVTSKAMTAVSWVNRHLQKDFYVKYNIPFLMRNMFRDAGATIKNIPRANVRKFLRFFPGAAGDTLDWLFTGRLSTDMKEAFKTGAMHVGRSYDTMVDNTVAVTDAKGKRKFVRAEDADVYDRVMAQFDEARQAEYSKNVATRGLRKAWKAFTFLFEKIGQFEETAGKLTGYKMLKHDKGGITGKSARIDDPTLRAHTVRTAAGTPDFTHGGKLKRMMNGIFLFSNVNIQGARAGIASFSADPARWLTKFALHKMPYTIMASLAREEELVNFMESAGITNQHWLNYCRFLEDGMQRIPEQIIARNFVHPLPGKSLPAVDGDGNLIKSKEKDRRQDYLRVPGEYLSQALGAIYYYAAKAAIREWKRSKDEKKAREQGKELDKDRETAADRGLDLAMKVGGELGDALPINEEKLNPVLQALIAWGKFMAGQQPVDAFTGRDIVPPNMQKLSRADQTAVMLKWTIDKTGPFSGFYRFYNPDENPIKMLRKERREELAKQDPDYVVRDDRTGLEKYNAVPGLGMAGKAFTGTTNYGMKEQEREAKRKAEARKERRKLRLEKERKEARKAGKE